MINLAIAADPVAWSVRSVSGDAEIQASGAAWQPIRGGQAVAVGNSIRTAGNGRVVIARDDESVTIAANSSFEIKPASNGMLTSVFQKIGTLMFKVHKRPDKHFEVSTPYLVAVVKGTTFTVSVDGNGSAVHVTEGLVEVGAFSGPEKLMLRPGQTGSISSTPGSKLQSGSVTPEKGSIPAKGKQKDKQTRGPGINRTIESASLDIEKASNGLFKNDRGHVGKQIASVGKGAKATVDDVAASVGSVGSSVVGGAIGGVTDGLGGAVGSVGGAVGGAVGGLTDGLGGAVGSVGGAVSSLGGAVGGAVGGLTGGLGGAVGGLGGSVGGAVSGLTGGLGGAVGDLGGAVGGTVGGVVGGVGGAVGGVGGTVGGVVDGVGGAVGGVLGGLGGLLGGKRS